MLPAELQQHLVTSVEALERLYGQPYGPSIAKETDRITPHYRGFVRVHDEKTLLVPDRRGNNRIDTLRNIVNDPRVALLFLIPGCGETIRVNGRAAISADPALAQTFVMNGKAPATVIIVAVDRVFYQCSKAIVRSKLWDPTLHVDRKSLPSAGTILDALTDGKLGGAAHDLNAPERIKATLY